MNRLAAQDALRAQLDPRVTRPITLVAGSGPEAATTVIDPRSAGLDLDVDATIDEAGEQPINPFTRLASFFSDRDVAPISKGNPVAVGQADRPGPSPARPALGGGHDPVRRGPRGARPLRPRPRRRRRGRTRRRPRALAGPGPRRAAGDDPAGVGDPGRHRRRDARRRGAGGGRAGLRRRRPPQRHAEPHRDRVLPALRPGRRRRADAPRRRAGRAGRRREGPGPDRDRAEGRRVHLPGRGRDRRPRRRGPGDRLPEDRHGPGGRPARARPTRPRRRRSRRRPRRPAAPRPRRRPRRAAR